MVYPAEKPFRPQKLLSCFFPAFAGTRACDDLGSQVHSELLGFFFSVEFASVPHNVRRLHGLGVARWTTDPDGMAEQRARYMALWPSPNHFLQLVDRLLPRQGRCNLGYRLEITNDLDERLGVWADGNEEEGSGYILGELDHWACASSSRPKIKARKNSTVSTMSERSTTSVRSP